MAVLSGVPGVKVTILVDDRARTEYNNLDDAQHNQEPPTTSTFIEAEDDKTFAIRVDTTPKFDWDGKVSILKIEVTVDGQFFRCHLLKRNALAMATEYCSATVNYRDFWCSEQNKWLFVKPKFTAVNTTDNADVKRIADDKKIARDLGVIQVKIRRAEIVGPDLKNWHGTGPDARDLTIAEKSLKGKDISHGTSFTQSEQLSHRPVFLDTRDLPGDRGYVGTVRFHYRSRAALQREMVLPRSLSPPRSTTAVDDLEGLSHEDLLRLAREQRAKLRTELEIKPESRIKRELDEVYDLTDDNDSARPRKKLETVDLTEE